MTWLHHLLVALSVDPHAVALEPARASAAVAAAYAEQGQAAPAPAPAPPGPAPKCCGQCVNGVITSGDGLHRGPCPCPATCKCKAGKTCPTGKCQ
jgi:hypothetical protein